VKLLLDSGVLGQLCHPKARESQPTFRWIQGILATGRAEVLVPEIADYELRRELLRLDLRDRDARSPRVARLDVIAGRHRLLALGSRTMRTAATLWAEARLRGKPTAPEDAIDVDAILAAQAREIGGTVVTENARHLEQWVPVLTPGDPLPEPEGEEE